MKTNTEKEAKWKSKEHVVWRIKGDLLVVLDTVSGHYYTLNETAVALWRGLFVEGKAFETVISDIGSCYPDAPTLAQVEAECRETLDYWAAEKLIEQTGA
jgi:hypothetical protein